MPNNQRGFDLNALKTDPKMWMRLAMPSKNGKYLENVFKDKENPFEKNDQVAVETLEKLAAEGKLYLRDFGRSRHFQKVEKGDDGLKLGTQHEIKLSNSTADFGLSVLMRLSRAYFKWIGLERVSNWFDGRLKRRSEIIELNNRYKEEYNSLTKEEKKELKALRKHEKIVKKLEKIRKEAERSEQSLNELRGQQAPTTTQQEPTVTQQVPTTTQQEPTATQQAPTTTQQEPTVTQQVPTTTQQEPTAPQQQAPLTQPPEIQPNENTMQPTLLGDQPVQQIPPAPPLPNPFAVKQTTQLEIPGTKKEENEQGENTRDNKIIIGGVELTDETINQFPPNVVEAFRVIQQRISEMEANKQANQQTVQQNIEEQLNKDQPNELDMGSINDIDEQQIENTTVQQDVEEQLNEDQPNELDMGSINDIDEQQIENTTVQQDIEEQLNKDQPNELDMGSINDIDEQQIENTTVQQDVEEQLNEDQPNELDMGSINDIDEQQIENTTVQQDVEEQLNEDQPNELDMGSINDIDEQLIENTDDQPEVTGGTLEQIFSNNPVQPTADEKVPDQEIDSPLKNGADLEPEQVNIQERHEDQAQMNLQKRLAAEKEAMDSVANWKDRLANTLFSHEEGDVVKDYYENIKDKPDGTYLLAGTVCGLLSAGGDPESKKQIMEGLLSGKPLGNEYSTRINESVAAYHNAVEQMSRGNHDPMTKLITDAALELGRQASQEDGLSPRHVMIGRMISNAMSLADEHKLVLNCNEEQWATIRGAFQMSKLAERHHNAKQYLGQEPMDVSSKDGRKAVRDLLMGNAIENLVKVGKYHGQQTTDVQLLMGTGCMTVESLTKMMSVTRIRKEITEERVRDIMEMPDSFDSARTAKHLGEELLSIAQEVTDAYGRERQMDMQRQNQPQNEQQLDPAQIMQPM